MKDKDFLRFAANWHQNLEFFMEVESSNGTLKSLLLSMEAVRVRKINPSLVFDYLGDRETGKRVGYGDEVDTYSGASILSPPLEDIIIGEDGRLSIGGTSNIRSVPCIFFSEDAVDKHASGDSKTECSIKLFVHEFDHFILYALQRIPMIIVSTLLFKEAIQRQSEALEDAEPKK